MKKKNHSLKRFSAGLIASAMAVGVMTVPVFAAAEDIIDTGRTGSITIHKYDSTAAERAGVDLTDFTTTGEQNATAEAALANYAIQGVVFSYVQVGDITTYSDAGSIEVVYDIPQSLMDILDLTADDAETTEGDTAYFTSDTLNTAMSDLLANNTDGKDQLEAWAAGNMTEMTETDASGVTSVSDVPVGLYLIIETQVPEEVMSTVNPFFVSVPMTNVSVDSEGNVIDRDELGDVTDGATNGDYWFYDIHAYPKNQTITPTLDKVAHENSMASDEYADSVTASEGDVISYRLVSQLPEMTSTATYLTKYEFIDTAAPGLTYDASSVQIEFYDNVEDATNHTGTPVFTWGADDFTASVGNELVDGIASGNTQLTVNPTAAGLQKLNATRDAGADSSQYSRLFMVVSYNCTVNSDATVVLGDEGNPNTAELTWSRTNTTYEETVEDKAVVYSYGIDLTKTFSDDAGDPTQVQFVLQNSTDGYWVQASSTEPGVYYVVTPDDYASGADSMDQVLPGATGEPTEEEATVFSPAADGTLVIHGLEADDYVLTEIQTDNGYSLLKEPINITINPTTSDIYASQATITGSVNDVQDGTADENGVVNQVGQNDPSDEYYTHAGWTEILEVNKESATATVDGNATVMNPDDNHEASEEALVQLSVLNSKTFTLPQTGGAGTWAITIVGVMGVAGGAAVLLKNKKKEAE